MLRLFSIMLITLIAGSAAGQDTLNQTDSRGFKQGLWRKRDSSGQIVYEGRFIDNVPTGEFRYFYPNGNLKTISQISGQGQKARTVSFFNNGKKMAAGNYLNEKKDSTWLFFSEMDGALVSEEQYLYGVVDGYSKIFYPDGQLSEIQHYKNGVREGVWEQYFTDGKVKLRGFYKSGERDGLFNTYFPNGRPLIEGNYKSGKQTGTWIYYDENGTVSKKDTYN